LGLLIRKSKNAFVFAEMSALSHRKHAPAAFSGKQNGIPLASAKKREGCPHGNLCIIVVIPVPTSHACLMNLQ
jgi:hypothetical protein